MTEQQFDVSEFDEEYESTTVRDSSGPELGEGKYQAEIVGSRTVEYDDRRWWVLDLVDLGGKGQVTKWSDFDHEVGRKVIKQDAITMGYRGESFSDIVGAIHDSFFDGIKVEIRVKVSPGEKRDFANVYINRLLDGATSGDREFVPDGASIHGDDDIPF